MRDLRQDLEDYHRYMAERSLKVIDLMVDSLPHAIDRALRGENFIKGLNKELADAQDQKSRAEAEVERLQKVYAITNESWKKQVEELTLLRKVADAARALIPSEMYQYTRYLFDMKHTLDEYDKAKEGKER